MKNLASAILALFVASSAAVQAQVPTPDPHYLTMAPVQKYLMPSAAAEIAFARTAAPASVTDHASFLVLTKTGYVTAVKGTNGWVCFVGRSWTGGLDDPQFWIPKTRASNCYNPPAARSVLPQYLARTNWALAGDTREVIKQKAKAAYASHQFIDPAPGSFSFMLSKLTILNPPGVHAWRPHVMLFIAYDQLATWAAGFDGSPIVAPPTGTLLPYEPMNIFIPVPHWSDGSPAPK